jgi:hypothetical protein
MKGVNSFNLELISSQEQTFQQMKSSKIFSSKVKPKTNNLYLSNILAITFDRVKSNQIKLKLKFDFDFDFFSQNGDTYGIIELGMWIFRIIFAVSFCCKVTTRIAQWKCQEKQRKRKRIRTS